MKFVIKYSLFAVLAIGVNLLCQELTLRVYKAQFQISLSIFIGTVAGLLVKYTLDKKYIFLFKTKHVLENSKKFLMYVVMGIATTIIFWGFEMSFEYIFHDKTMRYVGGFIGLCIGYVVKYNLDKRYVFTKNGHP